MPGMFVSLLAWGSFLASVRLAPSSLPVLTNPFLNSRSPRTRIALSAPTDVLVAGNTIAAVGTGCDGLRRRLIECPDDAKAGTDYAHCIMMASIRSHYDVRDPITSLLSTARRAPD